jgi:hypothetical protein
MPQLIAMVIVVVGAMIYMFQTFGGTGDKIEGVAQKNSVITEINNIKQGLKTGAQQKMISGATTNAAYPDAVKTLEGLSRIGLFAQQINEQILERSSEGDVVNVYNAISFGGNGNTTDALNNAIGSTNKSAMKISLVALAGHIPGIYVDLADGDLSGNASFLESSIAVDLKAIATIDRLAEAPTAAGKAPDTATTETEKRTPALTTSGGTNSDGKFIIYFKDFGADELVNN